MPEAQVTLLDLWTDLGILFTERKQVYGAPLTVIGINVDPNKLTFILPEKAKSNLLLQIEDFCAIPHGLLLTTRMAMPCGLDQLEL